MTSEELKAMHTLLDGPTSVTPKSVAQDFGPETSFIGTLVLVIVVFEDREGAFVYADCTIFTLIEIKTEKSKILIDFLKTHCTLT